MPLPELTTDTIYIQGRSGFSAVKIGGLRRALENDTIHATQDGIDGGKDRDSAELETCTLIKVAIAAQKFWRCTGLVYQGLLGGMALLHFVMVNISLFRVHKFLFLFLSNANISTIYFCRSTSSSTFPRSSRRITRSFPRCTRMYSPF